MAAAALDLVAPPMCLACGDEAMRRLGLGERCLRRLPVSAPCPCPRCAAPLGPGASQRGCAGCEEAHPRFAATVAAGPYAGFLGELVRRAKYGRDPLLATVLGRLLVTAVERSGLADGVDGVVPVPTTRRRLRERGFHLAEALSLEVARSVGKPVRTTWLERVGEPPAQAALPRSLRREAARGTVALRAPWWRMGPPRGITGATVLLVDDVLTTGSTANACTRALLAGGAREVRLAVATRA